MAPVNDEALVIDGDLSIPLAEIEFTAVRAQGPGGQHVNRSATAVQLRFDVAASSLPEGIRERLLARSDQRLTADGVVVIKAQDHRSQRRNREAALERLAELVREHRHAPKRRRATRPTKAARRRRLDEKKRRGETKRMRKPPKDSP